jgi:hypothetical protein
VTVVRLVQLDILKKMQTQLSTPKPGMENRLLNGFNYFWNRLPSDFNSRDVFLLHEWMKMMKKSIGASEKESLTEEDVYQIAKKIFTP